MLGPRVAPQRARVRDHMNRIVHERPCIEFGLERQRARGFDLCHLHIELRAHRFIRGAIDRTLVDEGLHEALAPSPEVGGSPLQHGRSAGRLLVALLPDVEDHRLEKPQVLGPRAQLVEQLDEGVLEGVPAASTNESKLFAARAAAPGELVAIEQVV